MSGLRILSLQGPAWVQDLGRPGHMHQAVPWGGALVPELLMAANLAVGNPPHWAAIEFFGRCAVQAEGGAMHLACDGDGIQLRAGERRPAQTAPGHRVAYLAVAGGLLLPRVLGGRGTLLSAGLGGHEGRPLRAGDLLPVGAPRPNADLPAAGVQRGRLGLPSPEQTLRLMPGPDRKEFAEAAWTTLVQAEWQVAASSDRIGTRLQGPALPSPRRRGQSAPMVAGAIQVPPSGQPIVLGPDHPTTGGYPVIAVLKRADLGALNLRPPGAQVRFQEQALPHYPGALR